MPASDITLLALDVDGVLTDGGIFVDDDGREFKRFNVRDGFAIKLWQSHGFQVAIITGRSSPGVRARAEQLDIRLFYDGVRDKSAALDRLIADSATPAERIAFVADDWPDLPAMARVGLSFAVADAEPEVIHAADHVTRRAGGHGAVRDAVRLLLESRGIYAPPAGREKTPRAI